MEPPELLALRQHVPDLIECVGLHGSVLAAPGLQGRIFCMIDGMMVHRLDVELLAKPHAEQFNNFGGNSLWPAPEGGPFAFNYLPGTGWLVQEGVNKTNMTYEPQASARDLEPKGDGRGAKGDAEKNGVNPPAFDTIVMHKNVELINRRGTRLKLVMRREVLPVSKGHPLNPNSPPTIRAVKCASWTGYYSTDTIEPLDSYSIDEALFAPWSLEQFPLSDDVVVFVQAEKPKTPLNFDYYGQPRDLEVACGSGGVALRLGGADKFQFGVRAVSKPQRIGALDRKRELLILRLAMPTHEAQQMMMRIHKRKNRPAPDKLEASLVSRYFNIADNNQPEGPWSAADAYSVFYGAGLGFFELETIAPARVNGDRLATSGLGSLTIICRGNLPALEEYVQSLIGCKLPPPR